MSKSDPFVRQAVIIGLAGNGKSVRGASLSEIKKKLGLPEVSNSAFDAAIGSLCYNYRLISWNRFWDAKSGLQTRSHVLTLR